MSTESTTTEDIRKGKPSASGIARLALCPASWLAEQRNPHESESKDAKVGTELHAHMEHDTNPVDPEQADAVNWCRQMQRQLVGLYLPNSTSTKEQRLWAKDESFSGAADIIFKDKKGDLLIIDYKFGRLGAPDATNNLQLAALAVLAYDNAETKPSIIYAAILAPYVSRSQPRIVQYKEGDIKAARDYIAKLLHNASNPAAPLKASMDACRYCKAMVTCPAVASKAQTCAKVESWDELTPEQKKTLYDNAKLAKKLCEKVEARIKDDLAAGATITGLKLSNGVSKFKINNPQLAFERLATLGISSKTFTSCCSVKISALDVVYHNTLKTENPKQTIKLSKENLRDFLSDCGEVETSSGSIKEGK